MSFEKQWKHLPLRWKGVQRLNLKRLNGLVGLNVNQYMVVTKFENYKGFVKMAIGFSIEDI
jgi:hypothetical protein